MEEKSYFFIVVKGTKEKEGDTKVSQSSCHVPDSLRMHTSLPRRSHNLNISQKHKPLTKGLLEDFQDSNYSI